MDSMTLGEPKRNKESRLAGESHRLSATVVLSIAALNMGILKMAKKQSGDKISSIAGKVLAGKPATKTEIKKLAGSVLGQDEKKGPRKR